MDLALGPIPDKGLDAAFRTEDLFYNEVIIAARRGHPLANARSIKELAGCEWVLTGPDTQGPGAAIYDAFHSHGLEPPRRVIQCDMTWTLQALLATSDLMCALPRQLLEQDLLNTVLRRVNVREVLPCYMVTLIYRNDAPLLPTAEHFATLLRRQARHVGRRYPGLKAQKAKFLGLGAVIGMTNSEARGPGAQHRLLLRPAVDATHLRPDVRCRAT